MIVATTAATREQPVNVENSPALRLPAGADPKEYYRGQLENNQSPFYRVAQSLAEMHLRGNLVKIIGPSQEVATAIGDCVSALAKILRAATPAPAKTPVPAAARVAARTAVYDPHAVPADSAIQLPSIQTATYIPPMPFEGEGHNLGRGYFGQVMENGSINVWYGSNPLAPLVNVPDLETAQKLVEETYKQAKGTMVEKHYVPAPSFLAAVNTAVGSMAAAAC